MSNINILELFGGIGAFTKACKRKNVKYNVADYVEIDKYAVNSYNALNRTEYSVQDIREWNKDVKVDIIMHGSNCQDFSIAGKQKGGDKDSGTRSSLMWETIRIVEKIRPNIIIWENVKNVLSKKHKHNFDKYIEDLDKLGYKSYYKVLNAKDFGIPQNRERIFCFSIKKELDKGFEFPEPVELKLRLKDMLESKVDEKYYLSDERCKALIKELNPDKYNCIDTKMQKNSKSKISKTILATCYKEPLNVVEPIVCEQRSDEGLRFFKNNICGTIRTIEAGGDKRILEDYRIRKLTPKECWRLMGFDDEDFEKAAKGCSNTQLYKQAGNSIVVNVLEAIIDKMIEYGYIS